MVRKEASSGQRFACDRPGCSKHYSRPDHLLRHKLNHDREKVLACDQCERTFVRQDLLARHLERHAVRGKTLGRWSSKRKRDGASEGSSQGGPYLDDGDEDEEAEGMMDSRHHYHQAGSSTSSTSLMSQAQGDRYGNAFQYIPPPLPPLPAQYIDTGTVQSNGMLPPSTSMGAMGMPTRDGMVSLGPPMPYSMPEHHQQPAPPPPPPPPPAPMPYGVTGYTPWQKTSFTPSTPSPPRPYEPLPQQPMMDMRASTGIGAPALLESSVPGSSHFTFSNPPTGDIIADYDWLFDGTNPLNAADLRSETSSALAPGEEAVDPNGAVGQIKSEKRSEAESSTDSGAENDGPDRQENESGALHDLAFFAILQRDIPDELAFDVDATVHARLLHFLSSVQELPTSPLFTPSALRCYLHLYFAKLNTIYPLIHRPTFSAKTADPMLLSAMILCGAHFADEAAHFLAERIGRKLWGAFISFEDFRPARATLALLQAMLLTELFGKTMGTRPQHETAHLFHNFIVTLARRNAVFSPSKVRLPSTPEERWRAWSREEEKKRIALFSFLLDAQHAIVFRHIPALSSFQIHLQLPCEEELWEAKSSQEWLAECTKRKLEPPSFIAALKASLSPEHGSSGPNNDSFQQFVLLHGLMSVAYDLQWKQQTLLAAPETSESISNWKDTLKASYVACKRRLDAGWHNTTSPTLRAICRASQSLVLWAQVVLHADSVDIQIYAGLPTVLGRFIDHHTFSVARRSCREWARGQDARLAVWLAANFLKATLLDVGEEETEAPSHSGFDDLLVHQWVQYLCGLVIWAYSQAWASPKMQQQRDTLSQPRSRDEESNGSMAAIPPAPGSSSMLQMSVTHAALSQRVPSETAPMDKASHEAGIYLARVIESDPEDEEAFSPPQQYVTAVLELVEKNCRGSRWELGREASGVLRKLVRERCGQFNMSSASPAPNFGVNE